MLYYSLKFLLQIPLRNSIIKCDSISNTCYQYQAFIQALLPTVVFPQRLSFFTVCWGRGGGHVRQSKGNFLKFRSADHLKVYFYCFFFLILEFREEEKLKTLKKSWLERYIKLSFLHVCKYLKQRGRKMGE